MRIEGIHFESCEAIALEITAGVITAIESISHDKNLPILAPGFFDLQVNGALGISFNSPQLTADSIRQVAQTCRSHGIAAFAPTLITAAYDDLLQAFTTLAKTLDEHAELARWMPVFHLEGPYISGEDGPRGAHPKAHIRPADFDEFRRLQDAAGGRIRLVTLAPEVPGAMPFIEAATASGVVIALGHTAATPDQIDDAVRAGARLSTHLGNGSAALQPRHENAFFAQLGHDRLCASLIVDGDHLPANLVKIILRVKSFDRVILTADTSSLAGLPPGVYEQWGQQLEVTTSGKVIVPGTPYLAGSGHFLDHCFRTLLKTQAVTLQEALAMCITQPRQLLSLPVPTFAVGQPAKVIAVSHDQQIWYFST
jgi:N-acetylglucosamine-6-phosphate deacetylase